MLWGRLLSEKCPICGNIKEKNFKFCEIHELAYSNLKKSYELWHIAYNKNLSKKSYFNKLLSLKETGEAVKEVILYLLKNYKSEEL